MHCQRNCTVIAVTVIAVIAFTATKVLVIPPSMAGSMIRRSPPRVKAGPKGHRFAAPALTSGVARLSCSAMPTMARCGGMCTMIVVGDGFATSLTRFRMGNEYYVLEEKNAMAYSPPYFSWHLAHH